ncbi:MATE efflux family protein NorM [Alteracholeplasma palmae J233]|uniref:MATE efflux family protein NorM n=1 Tax=Alteracholeplasma palmae (strain ATCC 49389 / J233) TaxID=1318466 RepID=U4KPD2_ALTPJ|nr:MATE family efflux transporter [Alteracholeplasma palmae]CCV64085.1 MATE efflux family protein NorM [Alteracholeplasma palmae J233]
MQNELSLKDQKRRHAILNGNLYKTVLVLSIPLAVYSLFNFLYTFIDMILVANIGSSHVNSVVFIDQIKSAISAFGMAIAASGTVIVARHYGASEIELARKNAGSTFVLSVVISTIVALITVVFGRQILTLAGATTEIIDTGLGYYNIQMISTTLIAVNSVFIGLEKAKGNTKIVLMLNLIVMVVKLVLSILFVYAFDGTVTDLATATLIAQLSLMIVAIFIMFNKKNVFRIKFNEIRLKKEFIVPIIVLALPIFFGKFLFSIGKVSINGLALKYDPYAVGALGVAMNIHGMFSAVATVFEESEVSIISQNLGNKNLSRAIKTFKISFIYLLVVSILGILILSFTYEGLIPLFSSNKAGEELTPHQIEMIKVMFKWEKYSLLTSPALGLITGLFVAFKKTQVTFILNIVRVFVFRLPVLYLFYKFTKMNYEAVGITMFISNTATFIVGGIVYLIFIRNLKHYGYQKMTFDELKLENVES